MFTHFYLAIANLPFGIQTSACVLLTALNCFLWFKNWELFDYRRNLAYQKMVIMDGHAKVMYEYKGMLVEKNRMVSVLRKREARANAARIKAIGWKVIKGEKLAA